MAEVKKKNPEARGLTILEFGRLGRVKHHEISEGKGGLKCSYHP